MEFRAAKKPGFNLLEYISGGEEGGTMNGGKWLLVRWKILTLLGKKITDIYRNPHTRRHSPTKEIPHRPPVYGF